MLASPASLPAETTTTAPRAIAASTADCMLALHGAVPPRLRFSTLAGFGLVGVPATGTPAAHRIESATSSKVPPQRPSARTGTMRALGATPAIPSALFELAAMMPATWVPCHELPKSNGFWHSPVPKSVSPGSDASASRPSSSLAIQVSLIMSKPVTRLASKSGCERMPVSMTATAIEPDGVPSHAAAARIPPAPVPNDHCCDHMVSLGIHW